MTERKYCIAEATSRFSKTWTHRDIYWDDLVRKLRTPVICPLTMDEYMIVDKEQQTSLKDVGGVVCGYLKDGLRKKQNLIRRSIITLDYDTFSLEQVSRLKEKFPYAWVVHSTMKSTPQALRVRIFLPLSRDVTPDEYEAISRRVASQIGFEGIDRSTFEPCRMMFYPCVCSDASYFFEENCTQNILEPDYILSTFQDWQDHSCWDFLPEEKKALELFSVSGGYDCDPKDRTPEQQVEAERIWQALAGSGRGKRKQEDPLTKKGVVGAFCRTYDVENAIDTFLGTVYTKSRTNRYTHIGSKTKGGAWILDNGRFLYSFHGTDPAYGKLLNAYDLVRFHLFGHLDEDVKKGTRTERLPSVKAMDELALGDDAVKKQLLKDRTLDFRGLDLNTKTSVPKDRISTKTQSKIERIWEEQATGLDFKGGDLKPSMANIVKILRYHPDFAGKIRFNEFSGQIDITGELPWKTLSKEWEDKDDANLRVYLESKWNITGREKISDAMVNVITTNVYHPVREYLNSLRWDKEERLDKLYTHVLGAEDTPLNRRLAVLTFVGAVARVLDPGCKFDYFIILQGPEGTCKSTLFSLMGGKWFTDSVTSIEGKEGCESLRGIWIAEMSELKAAKKSDTESIKSFISRQTDRMRPAYGRRVIEVPRQCIMVGTTNESAFLYGINTGNRRSPIVAIKPELRDCGLPVREYITLYRDQLWAEALYLYKHGSSLYLEDEYIPEAKRVQDDYNFDLQDTRWDDVAAFLDFYVPTGWETFTESEKLSWYAAHPNGGSSEANCDLRERITVSEILTYCLGLDKSAREWRTRGREVGDFLNRHKNWKNIGNVRYCTKYVAKTWERVFLTDLVRSNFQSEEYSLDDL